MNLDYNQQFANQLIDGDANECVALTVGDIAGNITHQLFDPDYTYAFTHYLEKVSPTEKGLHPYEGMLCPIVYGLLPISYDTFTAKIMGEDYVADIIHYSDTQRREAAKWVTSGLPIALHSYQDIFSYLNRYGAGVSLAVKWYTSFNTPNPDGSLPAPSGNFSYHNVAVYDAPMRGLMIKPWLGPDYGDHGYAYMTQTVFNQVFQEAYGFQINGWRWGSLAWIGATHPHIITKDILPQLKGGTIV